MWPRPDTSDVRRDSVRDIYTGGVIGPLSPIAPKQIVEPKVQVSLRAPSLRGSPYIAIRRNRHS